MRNVLSTLICFVLSCLCLPRFHPTLASTSGTILNFPETMNISVSSNIDFMFAKKVFEYDDKVHCKMDSLRMYIQGSFSPLEQVCLDARLGMADYEIQKRGSHGRNDPGQDYGLGFYYGLGLRGKVIQIPVLDTWVGMGAQYNYYSPKNTTRYGRVFESDAMEWILSLDLSRNLPELGPCGENITAYVGIRYSDLDIDYWHGPFTIRHGGLRNEDEIGVYLGTEYMHSERIHMHLELQFVDQNSIHIGAGYRF